VLEQDSITQFAGTLALEQSADSSSARGDIGRYWSVRLLLASTTSVAAIDAGSHERQQRITS